ncbi:MAG: 23S rRNA (pseudouridine(1915)-N(3))-methyltransferase RlmH [Planctomycetaceae bacterium]
MKLRIIAVGQRMPEWVVTAMADYIKRMPRDCRLELVEVAISQRGKDTVRGKLEEGERLLAAVGSRDRVICLDVKGKSWSTPELSQRLDHWRHEGRDTSFLIGGPDGLSPACLQRAELSWSLSPLTLPHALARVVVAEQLYRAWSILAGHPYHRE